jgi:hypothetical protein
MRMAAFMPHSGARFCSVCNTSNPVRVAPQPPAPARSVAVARDAVTTTTIAQAILSVMKGLGARQKFCRFMQTNYRRNGPSQRL